MQSGKYIAKAGLTAAIYIVLTVIFAPISFGVLQCRVSEALCILPYFFDAAVPGLFIGCLIANIITGAPVYDVLIGSFATLLGAFLTLIIAKKKWSAWILPLPTVLANAICIGFMLKYLYKFSVALPIGILSVAAGELISCYVLGMPLFFYLKKRNWEFLRQER